MIKPGWKIFFTTFLEEVRKEQTLNIAAAVAYYLLFSLFPAVIFLLTLLPYLPIPGLEFSLRQAIFIGLPSQSTELLQKVFNEVMAQQKGGLLSLGLFLSVMAGSSSLHVIIEELNSSYGFQKDLPWWKIRFRAVMLFFLITLLIIGAFTLIILGEKLQRQAFLLFGQGPLWELALTFLRWGIISGLLLLVLAVIFYFGTNEKLSFRSIIPGSTIGTLTLILATLPFSYYVDNFGSYNITYGGLGAVIVLLLWFYVVGLVVLLCGKFNALIGRFHKEIF